MYPEHRRSTTFAMVLAMVAILLALPVLAACGGDSGGGPGATPKDTVNAFIAGMEGENPTQVEALIPKDVIQAGAQHNWSVASEITGRGDKYGAPVKGQARISSLVENGATATGQVALVYDNKCSGCSPSSSTPDWAPKGSYVSNERLTLQKGNDGKWMLADWNY
jgi:hypothetical protein